MKSKQVTVLVVDDDEIDAECVIREFRKVRVANPVVRARDGLDALELLRGENGKEKLQSPYVILLDMNMPRMGGLEFLSAIRKDGDLKNSLVFVLTTSAHDGDYLQATRPDIAGYVVKDRVGLDFLDLINKHEHYWRIVEFPEQQ